MEEARVEALKRRVHQERETSERGRPRFSDGLKRDVAALLGTRGWGHRRVSKALGLSESSIHRWAERFAPRVTKQRDVAPGFKKAAIVGSDDKRTSPVTRAMLCLEFPCGARVTGLTLSQVAELMKGQP